MNASATQDPRWLHFDAAAVQDVQPSNPTTFIKRPEVGVHWLNFLGYPEESTWMEWRDALGLNPHMMMDAVDAKQRPLMEEYPEALFLSVKSIVKRKGSRVKMEHISFVLTNDYVLSIQQKVQDRFEAVITRIEEGRGIVRQRSVDYLLYRLLEAVIAPYSEALGSMEDHLDKLELAVVQSPSPEVMTQVLQLKRDLTNLRRALIPMKEVLGSIETSAFIKPEHHPYFRDVRDQAMQCVDRMDSLRSMLESLESLYLSSVGQRTNEVMRVLTVFSAIFLPITFLAGLYGMNFQNMPETETENGYFIVVSIMCATVGGMVWWMRRKGWI